MRPRPLAFTSALLLAALACGPDPDPGPGPDAPPPLSPAGRELASVCAEIRDSADPFYGEAPSRELAARLDEGIADPMERVAARALYGRELLKLDRVDEAIAELKAAIERTEQLRLHPSVLLEMKIYLGLAHLQAAEDENCLLHHSAASCLLPLRDEGIHRLTGHTRAAGDLFQQVAEAYPEATQTLLLLNLARMAAGEWPQAVPERFRLPGAVFEPEDPAFPRWRDRAPELGVATVDLAGGAVMDDFDGDGFLDLVSSTWDPCGGIKAFRNDGRGGFEDVAAAWGLAEQLGGLNLIHGDADGDGRLDLFVLRGAWMGPRGRIRNSLLRNTAGEGGPRFVDVTREAGLAEPAYPTQTAAFADYDGDGDLDLYVGNEDPDGASYPSQLFRNRGDGTFDEVGSTAGVSNHAFAKAVTWGDYDDDGWPDLYVSNIGPNRLYRNRGDGTFEDVAGALAVDEPRGRSFASWFFDLDNDGDLDLFVADYESPVAAVAAGFWGSKPVPNRPRLYRNDGGRFTEIGRQAGLDRALLPMGANHGDLDNDGFPDLYLGTGEPGYETVMPNVAFHNLGFGRFREITYAAGLGHLQKGHGVAFGDLDHDGDQDLFHQLGGFFPGDAYANALFENPSTATAWIALELEGRRANRFGVGARIEVRVREAGASRSIHALAGSGGTFGGSSLRQEIGLGAAESIDEIVIRWPGSGTVDRHPAPGLGRTYRAVEGAPGLEAVDRPRVPL